MTEAKTIKLLLSNGSLSGLLVAELLKWDGILFSSPRASYQLLSNEPESKFWGVYLLVSESKVYIGQANDLLRRISEHDKTKNWWEKVVLFTTKDNSLNRSDIDYLENKLIDIAKTTGTLEMNNIQHGNAPKVSRYRQTELEDFLDGALLLLELIGIKVFAKSINRNINDSLTEIVDQTSKDENKFIPNNPLFSNVIMDKRKAIVHFSNNGISFQNNNITFASLQKNKMAYWANPKIDFVNRDWYLILNNQFIKELSLLFIPAGTFTMHKEPNKISLNSRRDKTGLVDLNIDSLKLVDIRSKASFKPHLVKNINY